ncbi:NUDIX domain-containing protein [Halobaculum lipolyticum]|uniref:NUDIX domain-containing protein n=1 Tax=Halobaculum lipolyticum TaxID=3032001 RepID=A0ABD5WAN9_9EURY|nr:NUDIX domain-containing protein [Halobaculum sp. DT31]
MAHVVTAFLRNRGEVLLVRRSDTAGTYPGRWGGVSGSVEGDADDPLADARREVREETGIGEEQLTLVRRGDPVAVDDAEGSFTVHPFLFDCATRAATPNAELAATEWVRPPAMLARETVPRLWDAYRAVGPTAETVAADRTHGSAEVSVRALAALRDEAASLAHTDGSWDDLAATARRLRDARPGMTVLATRVNRVLQEADRTPTAVRDRAAAAVAAAVDADDRAAREAVALLAAHGDDGADPAVVTLSRSGTVAETLERLDGPVFVAESVPGGEGRDVAASLATDGRAVTLVPDAAVASLLATGRVDAAVVGADAVFPDGSVANKVGTRGLALAAAREGVPVFAVTARDKVAPTDAFHPEWADFAAPDGVEAYAPLFDRAPGECVSVVTEDGVFDREAVRAVAEDHRALAAWDAEGDADRGGDGDDGKE